MALGGSGNANAMTLNPYFDTIEPETWQGLLGDLLDILKDIVGTL